MDPVKTGTLIRTLSTRLGLTQRELAERLTVSDRTISKWERGPVFRTPDCSRSFPGSLRSPPNSSSPESCLPIERTLET